MDLIPYNSYTATMQLDFSDKIKVKIIEKVPSNVVVMGNIDPAGVLRMGTPEGVPQATTQLLQKCSTYPNFVLSSGCDIPPKTPWENLDAFFAAAEDFYKG